MSTQEMHAIMRGSVQGVFFRATTRDYAEEMGIEGTVKNLPEGTVEIYAQGTQEQLERLIDRLIKHYRLDRHETEILFYKPDGTYKGFKVIF